MIRIAVRCVVVIFVTTVVQYTVGVELRIHGATPELLFLLPIAAGMAGGTVDGALVGFAAGLAVDLFSPTPFGLSALVGTLVGAAVGAATGSLVRQVWWFASLVALAASAVAVMLYAVLGAVLGEDQYLHVGLATVIVVVAVVNAVLAAPALRAQRWALAQGEERAAGGGRR